MEAACAGVLQAACGLWPSHEAVDRTLYRRVKVAAHLVHPVLVAGVDAYSQANQAAAAGVRGEEQRIPENDELRVRRLLMDGVIHRLQVGGKQGIDHLRLEVD